MSAPQLIDAAVIGSGQAGPGLSTALATRGESVTLFEGGLLGGSCVNVGCTPTKTLRKSARIAHLARRASDFGVQVGDVAIDATAVLARMRDVVERSRTGLGKWIDGTANLALVRAWARLDGRAGDGRFVVRAGDQIFHASRVYLNVGTSPALPSVPGLAESKPLTNDTLLALDAFPAELVILGGSYIGLELGQIFARLGSRVTILEVGPAVAGREDPDVSAIIVSMLEEEGVRIVAGVTLRSVSRLADGTVAVSLRRPGATADEVIGGTHLLAATGRRARTDGLGLETVGIIPDAQGYVVVDGGLETSVPGLFALGDVNRRGAFTHTSWQDHEIVLANHAGGKRTADGRNTTYAMYTDPPLGRIGLSQSEAIALVAKGRRFLQATIPMANVSRAKEEGETTGLIRVLVDADTERFAGISMLGIGADEIVQVIGAMMAANAPYQVLRDFLPVHPTVTEFFPTILNRLKPLVATQWPVLDPALAPHLGDARRQLHHAVQFASAFGISFLEPSPDDSHSALEWHTALGALVSRPVPGEVRAAIRVGVRVSTLEIIVLKDDDVQSTLALHGVGLADATEALRAAIVALGLTASRYTLRRHFSIPPHPVTEGAAFNATDRAAFAALAAAFGGAAHSLEQLCAVTPNSGALLCWPHHFDLATLVQFAPGRSSGAGIVAGDQYYDEPYYYVNANPSPAKDALPDTLAGGGHWHSHEWIGAVLPTSRLASDAAAQEAQISSFLQSALAATQRLLAP